MTGLFAPGMAPQARRSALEQARVNGTLARRLALWHALETLLTDHESYTGRVQMTTSTDNAGCARHVLLHTRGEISDAISSLPILLLDATLPLRINRYFLPRLELLSELSVKAPHCTVMQMCGPFSKSKLVPTGRPDDDEAQTRLLGEVKDFIRLWHNGDSLLVTYQGIEQEFADIHGLQAAHFNAIAGLNAHSETCTVFVLGRPTPRESDVRDMALALTGRVVPEEEPRIQSRGQLLTDGSIVPIGCRAYDDPDLEAIREAIAAQVIQAAGWGRAVNRSAENPLLLIVLGNTPLPMPVDLFVNWDQVAPDVVDRMLARGAVLANAADAAAIYPDLFTSHDAARKVIRRARTGTSLTEESLSKKCPTPLAEVTYQPVGAGMKKRTAVVRIDRVDWLRDRLTGSIGELRLLEVAADGAVQHTCSNHAANRDIEDRVSA